MRYNETSILYIGSTAADATVTSRRVRGSMKSTLRVYEIPACAGMKCSRVAPARNTRARLGYVAGLYEPHKLGFGDGASGHGRKFVGACKEIAPPWANHERGNWGLHLSSCTVLMRISSTYQTIARSVTTLVGVLLLIITKCRPRRHHAAEAAM